MHLNIYAFIYLLSFCLFYIYVLWCFQTIKCKILHVTIQQSYNSLKKYAVYYHIFPPKQYNNDNSNKQLKFV